jgi:hypothetical protein
MEYTKEELQKALAATGLWKPEQSCDMPSLRGGLGLTRAPRALVDAL